MKQLETNWTADPRVPVILSNLGGVVRRHFNLFTRDEYWVYEGHAATALKAVRDEYGDRCMAYADADWDARCHVPRAWLNTPSVDDVITAALEAQPFKVAA